MTHATLAHEVPRYQIDVYRDGALIRTVTVTAGNAFIAELKAYRLLDDGESLRSSTPRRVH